MGHYKLSCYWNHYFNIFYYQAVIQVGLVTLDKKKDLLLN